MKNGLKFRQMTKCSPGVMGRSGAYRLPVAFIMLCMYLVGFTFISHAQTALQVTGKVLAVKGGQPLPGSTIEEIGSGHKTTTDSTGRFSITVKNSQTILIVTYTGYVPLEVKAEAGQFIKIHLEEESNELDKVVVTALGITRKERSLGYSVAQVDGDALTEGHENNAIVALSGKVAGVDISQSSAGPTGSTRVIIRGNSELSGNNQPLYVIDGVPMDNSQLGEADKWGGFDYGDGLSSISPQDIASVSVLKGASAAALYGSRATHGVILITTKSGRKKQGLGIEVSSSVNVVRQLSKFDDYQREYGQGTHGEAPNTPTLGQSTTQVAWGAKLDPSLQEYIYNGQKKPYQNVPDNILSFFRSGITYNNAVSFSGANGFRASISDMRNTDIVPNANMHRTTFMLRGKSDFGSKVSLEGRVNYSYEVVNNRPALSDDPNNVGNSLLGIAANFDQHWLSENYKDELGRYVNWNGGNIYRINPYWTINEMKNLSHKDRIMGYMQFNYSILPYLKLQLRGGTDFYNFKSDEYSPVYTPTDLSGSYKVRQFSVQENNFEAMLRFDKKYGDFSLSSFIAGNIRYSKNESYVNEGTQQVQSGIESILNYQNYTLDNNLFRKQVNSVYGDVNLGYKDYAYLDFTLRNDVSSTLAPENRSYLYPSVSGSFIFTDFFHINRKILSFGKLRASWAQVGGDTDPYQLALTYGLYAWTVNGHSLANINNTTIPNKNLKPTRTNAYEFGTELHLFDDRIEMDLGYYHQSTVDQIVQLSTSEASGYSKAAINAGQIDNKGIELSLTAFPIKTKDFNWTATVNFAHNENKVVKLHPSIKTYTLSEARWLDTYIYAMEGEAYGVIVGKAFKRDPGGNVIFKNGMPTYDEDYKVLGKGTPDFTLGFKHAFQYRNLRLSVLFDMKWGMDIYSMSMMQSYQDGTTTETLPGRADWYKSKAEQAAAGASNDDWVPTGGYVGKGVKNVGTDDNPEYVPNDVYVDPQDYWTNVTNNTPEPFIVDDSYIKLRELNLSYTLPERFLKKSFLQGATLSLFARNLLTLYTKVKNFDPESNYNSSNGQGFEYGSLPSRKTYGVSVDIKL